MKRPPLSSSHPEPDPLDDFLAQASWPEPSRDSTERLAARWNELSRRRIIPWRTLLPIAAAAAGLLVALGAAIVLTKSAFDRASRSVTIATPPTAPHSLPAALPIPPEATTPVGREPSPAEWVLIRAADRRAAAAPSRPPAPVVPARSSNETTAAARGARLAAFIAAADGQVDRATAKEFCATATPADLPLVLKLSRQPAVRDETVGALCRLADAAQLSQLARADWPSPQRRRFIAALVQRKSPDALQRYLDLVNEPACRADALAAMRSIADPPVDQLLPQLCGLRADLRVAAAAALAQVDRPAVTRRLIALAAADGPCRGNAFLALATSRDDDARRFVQRAAASDELAPWAKSALAQTRFQ